jgi:hypothetical protein
MTFECRADELLSFDFSRLDHDRPGVSRIMASAINSRNLEDISNKAVITLSSHSLLLSPLLPLLHMTGKREKLFLPL